MRKLTLLCILFLSLISCNQNEKPTVDYDKTESKQEIERDSTTIVINELPIEIDSTDYLLHIVGEPSSLSYGSSYGRFKLGSSNQSSFSVTSSYSSVISGDIHNVKFQKNESDSISSLTDKTILISSIHFLREVFQKNKKQYLVYQVHDSDTNGDEEINQMDLETLYLSKINGENFQKLTPEYHELIDYKIIKIQNRLYFRTIEDIDKNGDFDNGDKMHYFYLDFDEKSLSPKEYNYS